MAKNNKKNNLGFTLLFASLIVSLILSVGIAIANITLAQLTLSTAGRESQIALYNADTALECALYYQYKVIINPNSPDPALPWAFFPQVRAQTPAPMECAGMDNEQVRVNGQLFEAEVTTNGATTTSTYTFNLDPDTCEASEPSFLIEANKARVTRGDGSAYYNVTIRTRGYNTCNPNNPRRVERGLYVRNIVE